MSSFSDCNSISQGRYNRSNFTRQMRRSIKKVKKSIQKITDYDDATNEEPLHIVPECLTTLALQTGFTKKEICRLYRNFKQHCPRGAVTTNDFIPIYAKLFPLGNSRKYAQLVFNNFDQDRDGIVNFGDLLSVMAFIVKGNRDDKLSWIFRFYDLNGDGYITKQEMTIIVTAIYEIVRKHPINESTDHVERFFHKMDSNKDGVISKEEFMSCCKKDCAIISQLKHFDFI